MKLIRLAASAVRVLKNEGLRSLLHRVDQRVRSEVTATSVLAVKSDDVLAADWSDPPTRLAPRVVHDRPTTMAWIMSPPSANSGGHQNLFRFIDYAEKAGHRCAIYFYTNTPIVVNGDDMRRMLRKSGAYPDVQASMQMYDSAGGVDPATDAIFATGWETAYPAFLDASAARRFYFVQDFEPGFYPLGSQATLAENTYRFGFHAITAGGWLSHKLRTEYRMTADHFDFAIDRSTYFVENTGARNEIFFYARPATPRRGFELGILALEEFSRLRPGITINLAGEDVARRNVPFAHRNLAGVELSRLNTIYNACAAGLVLSASNMSLLPLELIASGAAAVVNDAPNNRMVTDNPYIEYVPATPAAIARRLVEIVDRPDLAERARTMSASLDGVSWDVSGAQFVEAYERAMHG